MNDLEAFLTLTSSLLTFHSRRSLLINHFYAFLGTKTFEISIFTTPERLLRSFLDRQIF